MSEGRSQAMNETTGSVGSFLRRERERRGITLKTISEQTKVSVALLEGLEADDLSRWPGGIFRRAFVRGYATSVGLDPDDIVRRFEQQHQPPPEETVEALAERPGAREPAPEPAPVVRPRTAVRSPRRVRLMATAADLTVALVLGLGSAAAGARMLWPVLLIAAYYGFSTVLTGQTPMMTLLAEDGGADGVRNAAAPQAFGKPVPRKGRADNARESRHDGSPRRRPGRVATVRH